MLTGDNNSLVAKPAGRKRTILIFMFTCWGKLSFCFIHNLFSIKHQGSVTIHKKHFPQQFPRQMSEFFPLRPCRRMYTQVNMKVKHYPKITPYCIDCTVFYAHKNKLKVLQKSELLQIRAINRFKKILHFFHRQGLTSVMTVLQVLSYTLENMIL